MMAGSSGRKSSQDGERIEWRLGKRVQREFPRFLFFAHRRVFQLGVDFPVAKTLVGEGVTVFNHAVVDTSISAEDPRQDAVMFVSYDRCRLDSYAGTARTKSPEVNARKPCEYFECFRIDLQDFALPLRVLAECFFRSIDPRAASPFPFGPAGR